MFEHGSAPLLRDRELEINHIGRRSGDGPEAATYLWGGELPDALGFVKQIVKLKLLSRISAIDARIKWP